MKFKSGYLIICALSLMIFVISSFLWSFYEKQLNQQTYSLFEKMTLISFIVMVVMIISGLMVSYFKNKISYSKFEQENQQNIEDFFKSIKDLDDIVLLNKVKDSMGTYELKRDGRLIPELIKYKKGYTLRYFIKEGINISGHETEIEELLSKSYVTKVREIDDFSDFFADRIN